MRALLFLVAATAACTPDIVSGSYLCGPEQACPEGLACNGTDNICVLPGAAEPFSCGTVTETEGNDSAQTAQPLGDGIACSTPRLEVIACAAADDPQDLYRFDVPASCASANVQLGLTFPLAFAVLEAELQDANGGVIATAGSCAGEDPDDAVDNRCLRSPVTPGMRYHVRVAPSGEGTCDGACAYNRYTLNLQVTSP